MSPTVNTFEATMNAAKLENHGVASSQCDNNCGIAHGFLERATSALTGLKTSTPP